MKRPHLKIIVLLIVFQTLVIIAKNEIIKNSLKLKIKLQEPSQSSTSSQNSCVKWAILENLNEIANLTDQQFIEVQERLKTLVNPQSKPSPSINEKKERK